jgi:exopolysaccharide biosynthesis polyprenyl glycosylphosphotransferase
VSHDRSLERWVLLQDVAVVVVSLWLAYAAHGALLAGWPMLKPTVPLLYYAPILLAFLPTWVWGADRLELSRVATLTGPLFRTVAALVWTQAWGTLAIALLLTVTQTPLNRSLIALFLAISTLLLLVATRFQRAWIIRVRGEALVLVIGDAPAEVDRDMALFRGRAVERLTDPEPAALQARLRQGGVDEVVISDLEPGRARVLVEACDEAGLALLLRLPDQGLAPFPPKVELVGGHVYLNFLRRDPDPAAMLFKHAIDRCFALVAVTALLPVMALIALAVKLTSKGPMLFVQERGGLNGRPFPMLKFRTMRTGAEDERQALLAANEMDGPVFKMTDDPRVTPLGKWLRRTSLDELPQLVNVLLGHMSLVGPRPLPLIETRDLTGAHRRRLSVRPGLTCLWQIKGRSALSFREWMALDLEYIENWSLGLDLVIVLRTIPVLLSGRGAR